MTKIGLTHLGSALAAMVIIGIAPAKATDPLPGEQTCSQELRAQPGITALSQWL